MNDEKILQDVWNVEQEILDVFVEVCDKYNLRYSLAYGTLLGAVRHNGFIPWDDDIDVLMPRNDYNKLIEIWPDNYSSKYIIQDPIHYADLPNNFIKIRKNHTTFIMFDCEKKASYQTGIFIDVFPMDRVAPTPFKRNIQKVCCMISLLYNRGYSSGKSTTRFFESILLKIVPKRKYRSVQRHFENLATQWNQFSELDYFNFSTLELMNIVYSKNEFNRLTEITFNSKHYKIFQNYDELLSKRYGNYMELPSEEERVWKHHPLIIDFEHNYEERI